MYDVVVTVSLLSASYRESDRYGGFRKHVKHHLITFILPPSLILIPVKPGQPAGLSGLFVLTVVNIDDSRMDCRMLHLTVVVFVY